MTNLQLKYCDKCKESHPIEKPYWDFRPNTYGNQTPYRCKEFRRRQYAEEVAKASKEKLQPPVDPKKD